jgi:hypothetical protein
VNAVQAAGRWGYWHLEQAHEWIAGWIGLALADVQ